MILGKKISTNQKDLDFTEDLSATLRNACMQFLESDSYTQGKLFTTNYKRS